LTGWGAGLLLADAPTLSAKLFDLRLKQERMIGLPAIHARSANAVAGH
jgi:hypothetical protein